MRAATLSTDAEQARTADPCQQADPLRTAIGTHCSTMRLVTEPPAIACVTL